MHTPNDCWNEESESLFSVEWIETTRSHQKVANGGRPTKGTNNHKTSHDLARRMAQIVRETKDRGDHTLGRNKTQIARRYSEKKILRGCARKHRLLQGDLRCSRKTRDMRGAVGNLQQCRFSKALGNVTLRHQRKLRT